MGLFFPGARGSILYVPEGPVAAALPDYTSTGNTVAQPATGISTFDPLSGGPLYAELEDPKRWTVRDPSGWSNLSRWIKDYFPTLSTVTQFQNRVDQVAARFETTTGQVATAGALKGYGPMLQALEALALGYHELPPIFALAATPTGSVATPAAGAPTGTEGEAPAPAGTPSVALQQIAQRPGLEPGLEETLAPTGGTPTEPMVNYYTNPYTGQQLPMVPQGEVTYYLNTIYGPQPVDYFTALLFSQATNAVQELAVQTMPVQDPLESVWGQRYLQGIRTGEQAPPTYTPGLGGIAQNLENVREYERAEASGTNIPAGPWQSILVPPMTEEAITTETSPEEWAQNYNPGPAWHLVKDQDEVGNERWSWAMDPNMVNTLRTQLVGSGQTADIPLFTPETLGQYLASAQGATTYGSGSGSKITFDREEVKQYIESVWRAYLLEQLDDNTAYSLADDYIDEATSFYQEGGNLDLEAWIVHKIRGNARHHLLYRYKPGALDELDYIKGFITAASSTGVPERLYEPRITSAMSSGASAEGFALRSSRSPEVFAANPNTFISRLAQTAAASVGGID